MKTYKKNTPGLIEEAKKLRSTGLSYTKIGEEIGVSQSTAIRWLNERVYKQDQEYGKKYRKENKEKIKQDWAIWYEKNKGYKNEQSRIWREHNPLKVIEQNKDYQREHREERTQYFKEYRHGKGRGPYTAAIRNRKARTKGATGNVSSTDIEIKAKSQSGKCYYCGVVMDTCFDPSNWKSQTVDHLVPILKGGNNDFENTVLSCLRCNCRKSTMSVREFMDRNQIGVTVPQ